MKRATLQLFQKKSTLLEHHQKYKKVHKRTSSVMVDILNTKTKDDDEVDKKHTQDSFSIFGWMFYKFDTFISGQRGQTTVLILFGLGLNIVFAPLVANVSGKTYTNAVWSVWTYMADPGSQSEDYRWVRSNLSYYQFLQNHRIIENTDTTPCFHYINNHWYHVLLYCHWLCCG